MFKKKSSTLPRPSPPGPKHMLEDLSNIDKDDIIFILMKSNASLCGSIFGNASPESGVNNFNSDNEDTEQMPIDLENSNGAEAMYAKVKSFVEENNELQSIMKELQQKHEALQTCDLELKKMAEDIRKQAIDALK